MALRTPEEYKAGLRGGREVYIFGKKVPDVTEDPYIKVGVETGAEVCSIHAEGSFATQKMMLLVEAPSKHYKSKARDIVGLDG